jgi:RhtB (resistance to homoserine/threonine) family protein
MTWSAYGTFVALAALLVLAPGPDFAVVLENSLTGGRRRGLAASLGVASSNVVQGTAAAFGLGAVIARSQALFEVIRWAGVVYLAWLGIQALRSAWLARDEPAADGPSTPAPRTPVLTGWRQGFLSNITNPKVLVFYLSVLPQFLHPGEASVASGVALAYTHATLSLLWLAVLVTVLHGAREWVRRRRVRRSLEGVTGVALLGFGARLAADGH